VLLIDIMKLKVTRTPGFRQCVQKLNEGVNPPIHDVLLERLVVTRVLTITISLINLGVLPVTY